MSASATQRQKADRPISTNSGHVSCRRPTAGMGATLAKLEMARESAFWAQPNVLRTAATRAH